MYIRKRHRLQIEPKINEVRSQTQSLPPNKLHTRYPWLKPLNVKLLWLYRFLFQNFYPEKNFYLEIKIVLRILVKHLPICSCSDFCDFLRACIAKSFNLLGSWSTKGESNTAQKTHELKIDSFLKFTPKLVSNIGTKDHFVNGWVCKKGNTYAFVAKMLKG